MGIAQKIHYNDELEFDEEIFLIEQIERSRIMLEQ
jgi:hypothetical protein